VFSLSFFGGGLKCGRDSFGGGKRRFLGDGEGELRGMGGGGGGD